MKFIKLEILNLASLDKQDGEVINFEEGALKESNIFSIVGPTGSGKSTILDAICLALYNRAPRYPRKSGERGKIVILGEADETESYRLAPTDGRNILTRGKKEGYSKLTFLANNGCTYRAEWHVRFKLKNYDNADTFLYKITSKDGILQEEIAEWSSLPQIIGLDYEQFLRTVLIAQGSFAEFLKQSDDQRFELLEKLIGCEDLYTNIAKKIKEKEQQVKEAFQELNASNEAYLQSDLTAEELAALKSAIEELTKQESTVKQELEAVNKALDWFIQEEKHNQNLQQYEQEKLRCQEALNLLTDKSNRLALHDATLEAVALYKEMQDKERSIQLFNKQLEDLNGQALDLNTKLGEAREELNKRIENAQKQSDRFDKGKPHIEAARVLKGELNSDRSNLQMKAEELQRANDQLKNANAAVLQNAEAIQKADKLLKENIHKCEQLQKVIEQDTSQLATAANQANLAYEPEQQKLGALNLAELQRQANEAVTRENELKEAIRIQRELQIKTKQQRDNEQTIKNLTDRNKELDQLLGTLTIEKLTEDVGAFERICTLMSSENWEKHRSELQEGEKCPLCGATHHPYADSADYQKDLSVSERMLKEKKEALAEQNTHKETWDKEKIKNTTTITQLTQSTLTQEIEKLQDEWKAVSGRHPSWPAEVQALEAMKPALAQEKQMAEQTLSNYNDLQDKVEKLRHQKEAADRMLQDYKDKAVQRKQKADNDVSLANTALETERGKTENLLAQQQQGVEAQDKAAEAYNDLNTAIQNKQKEMESHVGKYDPDALEAELLKRKEDAEKLVKDQEEIINQHNRACEGVKGQIGATQKQIEEFGKQRKESSDKLDNWLKSNANITRETVAEMYAATDSWEAYRTEISKSKDDYTRATTTFSNETAAHEKHQENKPASSKEDLDARKTELASWSNEELIGKRARLQQYEDAQKAMGELRDKLTAAAQLKKNWEEISKAIGSDGKDLRKIAQCYTLRFLVEHANAEIQKFNGRYELQQVRNSLALRIIDHDRADDIRDVTTLSGGETFIVSLGLALGLSSLSSGSIAFDNLFVDEGFGTLDPDMLATVIDSLAALQSSQGKKVGVISHTDTMSERITTQIRIIKNGNSGSSHIEIYPN